MPQGDDGRPPAHATSARTGPGGGSAWGAALSVGAANLWAKAATATSEIVKDLTKPPRHVHGRSFPVGLFFLYPCVPSHAYQRTLYCHTITLPYRQTPSTVSFLCVPPQ